MSEYYNPIENKVHISEMELPGFVKEYLNYLLNEVNLAPRSIFNYSVSIQTFLRWIIYIETKPDFSSFHEIDVSGMKPEQISGITRSDILEFLTFCADKLSNSSVSRAAKTAALRSMYDYLCNKSDRRDVFQQNPMTNISSPKMTGRLPVYMTMDEIDKFLGAIDNKRTGCRDYCIFFWFLTCGMRLSELVRIDLTDIRDDTIRIYGKGRKERLVPLNSECKKVLEDYILERSLYPRKEDENALFISPRTGKRLTGRRIEQMMEDYLLKAGLSGNGYSPHKLRHTAATTLYNEAGADVLELRDLLGHESVATTQIYSHLAPDRVKNVLEKSPVIAHKQRNIDI